LGASPRQLRRLLPAAAAIITSLGGPGGLLLGGGLLLLFERSMGNWFDAVGVPFRWPPLLLLAQYALGCGLLAAGAGLVAAGVPAWRAGRRDPYDLGRTLGGLCCKPATCRKTTPPGRTPARPVPA